MIGAGAPPEADPDLFEDFREFLECVNAHLEWHRDSGTIGLPRDLGAKARVEAFALELAPRARPSETSSPGRLRGDDGPLQTPADAPPPPRAGTTRPTPAVQGSGAKSREAAETLPRVAEAASIAASPAGGRLPIADEKIASASLAELRQLVSACTACGLHSGRKQTVFSRGTGSSRICFIGEGPGADEDEQGEPFVGAAGQLLDRMIVAMGLSREEVYVCNIVKCRPPNNRKPEPGEMAACTPFLARQLELIDPEVIVALGGTAVTGLLGITEGITRIRGTFRLYQGRIPVMPTFHPAYLLRTPGAKREVWADLKAVLQHLGRPLPA
jgi:uracil-DNA glycosylase